MSVNKVILLGHVGADPEIRYPEKDRQIAYLSLATNEVRGAARTEMAFARFWRAERCHGREICEKGLTALCGRLFADSRV